MRNCCLAISGLLLVFPAFSYAQDSMSVRSLATQQLCLYGQALYDRGDYPQASQIFSKVLDVDPNNKKALHYVNVMEKKEEAQSAAQIDQELKQSAQSKVSDEDLKKSIQETDQVVEKLKVEVADLRQQIAKGH